MERGTMGFSNYSHSNSSDSITLSSLELNSLDKSKKSCQKSSEISALSFFSTTSNKVPKSLQGTEQPQYKAKTMETLSRLQKRRNRTSAPSENLSVTLHTSDSDYKRRRARAGFDRQTSISRWMADAVNDKCDKLLRAVTSHESLLSLSSRSFSSKTSKSLDMTSPKHQRNAAFKIFPRADANVLNKPVRKRSSGPGALLNDCLLVMNEENLLEESPRSKRSGRRPRPFDLFRQAPALDDGDIEEETEREEDEPLLGGLVRSSSQGPGFPGQDSDADTISQASLVMERGRSRWDASSSIHQEEVPKPDRSSKTMPVHPPPPFSPMKQKATLPDGFFQRGCSKALINNEDQAMGDGICNSNQKNVARDHLREKLAFKKTPLAAASAAIAIATDSMDLEDDHFEEETGLNDLLEKNKKSQHTDAATANSGASTWQEGASSASTWHDSVISDGISLLSASNASLPFWTEKSSSSIGLGYALSQLDEYEEESNYKSRCPTPNRSNNHNNNSIGLGYALSQLDEYDVESNCESSSNRDYSSKSIANSTIESGYTFYGDSHCSPGLKTQIPLKKPKPSGEQINHLAPLAPLLEPPTPPLDPPCMPRRSISNHCKQELQPSTSIPIISPSDRVQRLLDFNSKKYTKSTRRLSLPEKDTGRSERSERTAGNSLYRRRASLDSADSPGSSTYNSSSPPITPYEQEECRRLKILSLQQSSVTSKLSKTSRSSPSIKTSSRKRIEEPSPSPPKTSSRKRIEEPSPSPPLTPSHRSRRRVGQPRQNKSNGSPSSSTLSPTDKAISYMTSPSSSSHSRTTTSSSQRTPNSRNCNNHYIKAPPLSVREYLAASPGVQN